VDLYSEVQLRAEPSEALRGDKSADVDLSRWRDTELQPVSMGLRLQRLVTVAEMNKTLVA
jgi:hypothetical protein